MTIATDSLHHGTMDNQMDQLQPKWLGPKGQHELMKEDYDEN